jgi:hypothetical protein
LQWVGHQKGTRLEVHATSQHDLFVPF